MEWFPQTAFASLKQSSSKSECSYWSRVAVSVRVNNRQSMGILSLNFDFFLSFLCYAIFVSLVTGYACVDIQLFVWYMLLCKFVK